ncbi:robin [Acanthamoeba polyphaga mimivirus]|nr:robin [Mimivirus reunion]WMV61776.1 robin [Mimivirus sp.]WMV62753.1 robin [Acanthamoeba polyphaga mimivirus]WMV63730.1 robin [Mimivirus sp.]
MKHFTFADNYLRTYIDTVTFGFKFIVHPVNYTDLSISIMIGEQNLFNLVKLIPNVRKLHLYFTDENTKYNLESITKLTKLRVLVVFSQFEKKSRPRLYNIKSLNKLKLDSIVIYDKILDPFNPVYQWPQIRDRKFKSVKSIDIKGPIINYNVNRTRFHNHLFEKYPVCCSNFIVQLINQPDNTQIYQVIYRYQEQYIEDQIYIQTIDKSKFLRFIYGENVLNTEIYYPQCQQDLYIDDIDNNSN